MTFHAGMHLWSNPSRRGTDAAVPVILRDPTLFDLVELAKRKPVPELASINDQLLATGDITARQHDRTQDILTKITTCLQRLHAA
jgi:hypothetical protein